MKVEGMWVLIKIEDHGLAKGFITKETANGEHKVMIVDAELKSLIGKEKWVKYGDIRRSSDVISPQEARELIDIALLIKDKAWFEELSAIASEREPAPIDRWNRKLSWEMN